MEKYLQRCLFHFKLISDFLYRVTVGKFREELGYRKSGSTKANHAPKFLRVALKTVPQGTHRLVVAMPCLELMHNAEWKIKPEVYGP